MRTWPMGLERSLNSLPIGFAAVSDAEDTNGLHAVVDFEKNTVIPNPEAPHVGGAAEFGNARRSRFLFEIEEGLVNA